MVGPFTRGITPSTSLAGWQQTIAANPGALSYFGGCSIDSDSLATIKTKAHAKWPLLGHDMDPVIARDIQNGVMKESLTASKWLERYLATYYAIEHSAGKDPSVTGWLSPGIMVATPRNIAAIIKRESATKCQKPYYATLLHKILADPHKYLNPFAAATQY